MKPILSEYNVNESTMALLPVAHVDYDTIVLERDQQLFVKQTPIQIIQSSCLNNWATYEGRRAAVIHRTGFKQKVPIPISPSKNIFTFPTHAQDDFNCCWIFYNHVIKVAQDPSHNSESIIIFKNGGKLPVHVSKHILEKQMQRTLACMIGGIGMEEVIKQQ